MFEAAHRLGLSGWTVEDLAESFRPARQERQLHERTLRQCLGGCAGRGRLAAVDPRLKLAWLMAISTASVLVDANAALGVLFAAAAVPAVWLKMRLKGWLLLLGLLAITAWGTMLSQALFFYVDSFAQVDVVPPFNLAGAHFDGLRLTSEGAWEGLRQSLRLLGLTLAGISVAISTSPERLLSALVRNGVPAALSFMAVAALRFLPAMLDEWWTIREAVQMRGYRPCWWSRPLATLRQELVLLVPLLAATLRRATALATMFPVAASILPQTDLLSSVADDDRGTGRLPVIGSGRGGPHIRENFVLDRTKHGT